MNNSVTRVLLVDDEIEVIKGYRDYLVSYFDVVLANSVDEALQILQTQEIHVLVVDMVMPGKDGKTLLNVANSEYRRPIKIILSAYVDEFFDDQFQNEFRVYGVLRKPLPQMRDLLRFITEAAQEYVFRYGTPEPTPQGFLNAEEIMGKMGVSRPTLYKYLRTGLPSRQVCGRRFFDWNEVVSWMNRQPNFFQKANALT